jgi:hypothetical protein
MDGALNHMWQWDLNLLGAKHDPCNKLNSTIGPFVLWVSESLSTSYRPGL